MRVHKTLLIATYSTSDAAPGDPVSVFTVFAATARRERSRLPGDHRRGVSCAVCINTTAPRPYRNSRASHSPKTTLFESQTTSSPTDHGRAASRYESFASENDNTRIPWRIETGH